MSLLQVGPQLAFSDALHAEKYRAEGESFRESQNRVASALTDHDYEFQKLRGILLPMKYLFGGRIQAAVGALKSTTAYNCFVAPTILDSFVEGENSIMDVANKAVATMRLGGGIGYDFSTLRPRGDMIQKLLSRSSGPVSFMEIYDACCRCIASSGHRRGAQMGVLRVDHPDIELFIRAKQNNLSLTGFNLSIGITDEFMTCVRTNSMFKLRWGGKIYKEIHARQLWELIMRSTWDWAEPGVIFIDTINRLNNLWYCEWIAATNPCGELPLPPNGACLLGSFNLAKYTTYFMKKGYFDWNGFKSDIPVIIEAMDNVIDRTIYPLDEQKLEAMNKRRMGVGITALANSLEAQGAPYGSDHFIELEENVMRTLRDESYRASIELAKRKGPFPLFDRDKYLQGEFIKALPDDIQEGIYKYGIRNSHLNSIAPTGTISSTADNVSSGCEPVFAYEYNRTVADFEGKKEYKISDYAYREWGIKGRPAKEVTAKQHVLVLSTAQRFIDSAVSKTCNIPSTMSWSEFEQVYWDAYESGCKGCTTYRVDGKRGAILNEVKDTTSEQEEIWEALMDICEELSPESGIREKHQSLPESDRKFLLHKLESVINEASNKPLLEELRKEVDNKVSCTIDPLTGQKECE